MKLYSILGVISFLCLTTTLAQEISWSKPGCPEKCGNITIPYPFGIGLGCSETSFFNITCNSSTTPAKPFLSSINLQVLNISVQGVVIVNQPISPMGCSDKQATGFLPMSLGGSPFTISARYNTLAVLGCTNSVWLLANETTTVGGCMAICQATTKNASTDCSGLNCCRGTIPRGLQDFRYYYRSIQNNNGNFCGYAFPVDKKWFRQDYIKYRGLHTNQSHPYDEEFVFAPLVLEWELDNYVLNRLGSCKSADDYSYGTSYRDEYTDPSTSFYFYSYYDGYE